MKRIYHTWEKWECYPAGFYENQPKENLTKEECERIYADLLKDPSQFHNALGRVVDEWPISCEQYLSNDKMNRIAWLGQAALCVAKGIPANYRNGFNLLSLKQQEAANNMALDALNSWLIHHGEEPVNMEGAGVNAKADLY